MLAQLVLTGIVALGLTMTNASAFSFPHPVSYFTCDSKDVLNITIGGPIAEGKPGFVRNLLLQVSWSSTTSTGKTAKITSGSCVSNQGASANNGDSNFFCGSKDCRNHVRWWGYPDQFGPASINAASTEHYLCCNTTHVVDSYNHGRDWLGNDLFTAVSRAGYWGAGSFYVKKYNGGTIGQPDGSSAPYDGYVLYVCIIQSSNEGGCPSSA
jgi:hypothetical protein